MMVQYHLKQKDKLHSAGAVRDKRTLAIFVRELMEVHLS